MKRFSLFFTSIVVCIFLINTTTATASTVNTTTSSETASSSTATEKTITMHVVCAYNHKISIPNLDIFLKEPSTGETISATTDAQGEITLSCMATGIYNVYVTDTYGNCASAESSIDITDNNATSMIIPVPLSKLQVTYQNTSPKNYQSPSYTISGAFDKSYKLSSLAAGTAITNESGFVINGTSYLVTAKSEKGIIEQHYFEIPFKVSNFCIQIYDRNASIFMKHA